MIRSHNYIAHMSLYVGILYNKKGRGGSDALSRVSSFMSVIIQWKLSRFKIQSQVSSFMKVPRFLKLV